MRRNISSKITLLIILTILFGCKAKKEILASSPVTSSVSTENINLTKSEVFNGISKNQLNFNTLTLRAKSNLNIDKEENDVTLNIRIKKDEVIWVSVTAIAGLEVARALITPDSIKILNRLESTYTAKSFSFIHEYTNSQVNFKTLQSILTGEPILEFLNDEAVIKSDSDKIDVSGVLNQLSYAFSLNRTFKIIHTDINDKLKNQELGVSYGGFSAENGTTLAHSVNIRSKVEGRDVAISLQYLRIAFNEIFEAPFSVPARFTKNN